MADLLGVSAELAQQVKLCGPAQVHIDQAQRRWPIGAQTTPLTCEHRDRKEMFVPRSVLSASLSGVTSRSSLVTIDLAIVEQEVVRAEERLKKAIDERDRVMAEQHFLVDEAEAELRQTRTTLKILTSAAVDAGSKERVLVPKSRQIRGDASEKLIDLVSTDLRNVPTKEAALRILRDNSDTVFSLQELHEEMERHGYEGTHNAVHVAISRQMQDGAPIARVHKGHYQYDERGASSDDAPAAGSPGS